MDMHTFDRMRRYSDWANDRIVAVASEFEDAQLDRDMEIGLGSLRNTLKHIHDGESVWLARWQGRAETPWPSYDERPDMRSLADRFSQTAVDRDAFLKTLTPADLERPVTYRDSKGSLFTATLGDMILQGINHSVHHRAQAVNIIRRLGGGLVELDYMVFVRKPV